LKQAGITRFWERGNVKTITCSKTLNDLMQPTFVSNRHLEW
jgi:hypothetical protein